MNDINLQEISTIPSLEVIVETILLSANEPIPLKKLQESLPNEYDTLSVQEALEALQNKWQERGLELINTALGYRFRTRLNMQIYVERSQSSRTPRYAKSVMETLAVIVYRQPVTRADIENIRGVTVNSNAIKTLESRGWIETVGVKKDTPGQPQLWGTTKKLLSDLGLKKLADLPPLSEIADALENPQLTKTTENDSALIVKQVLPIIDSSLGENTLLKNLTTAKNNLNLEGFAEKADFDSDGDIEVDTVKSLNSKLISDDKFENN